MTPVSLVAEACDGEDYLPLAESLDRAARGSIGIIGHGIGIYDELSALENLRLFHASDLVHQFGHAKPAFHA